MTATKFLRVIAQIVVHNILNTNEANPYKMHTYFTSLFVCSGGIHVYYNTCNSLNIFSKGSYLYIHKLRKSIEIC